MEQSLLPMDNLSKLEKKLLNMYLNRAIENKKPVNIITDIDKYNELHKKGDLLNINNYYLFTDSKDYSIKDFLPIVYHLIDTKEGEKYARKLFSQSNFTSFQKILNF